MDVIALVFFFKQKTAYEMRISDWSSDVCSSDLKNGEALLHHRRFNRRLPLLARGIGFDRLQHAEHVAAGDLFELGLRIAAFRQLDEQRPIARHILHAARPRIHPVIFTPGPDMTTADRLFERTTLIRPLRYPGPPPPMAG